MQQVAQVALVALVALAVLVQQVQLARSGSVALVFRRMALVQTVTTTSTLRTVTCTSRQQALGSSLARSEVGVGLLQSRPTRQERPCHS